MKVLDLFSGIGGFSLGLERAGMETVAFCEIDKFCQKVLKKHWPDIPIHDNIKTLRGNQYGSIDVVCGGFPCQPFSSAGKRKGKNDDRDLWPEMFRIIREARPTWVIGENVAGFVNMEFERTASDLEAEGYEVQAFIIPACAVGAPHRRDRIWIVAYSASCDDRRNARELCQKNGGSKRNLLSEFGSTSEISATLPNNDSLIRGLQQKQRQKCEDTAKFGNDGKAQSVANSDISNEQRIEQRGDDKEVGEKSGKGSAGLCNGEGGYNQWTVEPDVGRVAHGVPARMDRLKSLGNAVVPQIPELIGRAIMVQVR